MKKPKLTFNEITSDELVRLLGYTVNKVLEGDDSVVIEFTKQIDGAIVGIELMLEDNCMLMSQEYLIDTSETA